MEIRDIRQLTDDQIVDAIEDNREERWKLRFQDATGELKNTNLLRENKRVLARLKTVQAERQAQAQTSSNKDKKNG